MTARERRELLSDARIWRRIAERLPEATGHMIGLCSQVGASAGTVGRRHRMDAHLLTHQPEFVSQTWPYWWPRTRAGIRKRQQVCEAIAQRLEREARK
jgi:hypothetical protein